MWLLCNNKVNYQNIALFAYSRAYLLVLVVIQMNSAPAFIFEWLLKVLNLVRLTSKIGLRQLKWSGLVNNNTLCYTSVKTILAGSDQQHYVDYKTLLFNPMAYWRQLWWIMSYMTLAENVSVIVSLSSIDWSPYKSPQNPALPDTSADLAATVSEIFVEISVCWRKVDIALG